MITISFESCQKTEDPKPQPTINWVSPPSAKVGAPVTISGTNFGINGSEMNVSFNGTPSVVTAFSETQISTTVPTSATSGQITVTTNGLIAFSPTDFVIISPPALLSFYPVSGYVGSTVLITGANFSSNRSQNVVKFNGIPADVLAAKPTELKVTVPSGAVTGPITIIVNGMMANSVSDFSIETPPTIFSVFPTYGLPGEIITITGNGFRSTDAASYSVTLRGEAIVINEVTDTQVKFRIPATAATGSLVATLRNEVVPLGNFEVLKNILRNGLVAFFPFNGNADDESSSGNVLHGIVTGPELSTDRFGKPNACYSFDGVDDFISLGNPNALQITPDITLAAWVKTAGSPRTINVLSKIGKDVNDLYHGYTFHCYKAAFANTYLHGLVVDGTSGSILTKGDWSPEEWTFIAVSQHGDEVKVYQNNIKIAEATGQRSLANINVTLGDFLIGRGVIVEDFFSGSIDDISIYNRALSEAEINQLFQQTVTKY